MRSDDSTRTTIARWRTARRAVLGAIIIAGSVVTSAAVMMRMGTRDCDGYHRVDRAYTYSGIGVVIERHHGEVVVRRVLRGSPAQGKLRPGTRLVAVDDNNPPTLEGWASAIRGEPGTTVELEVAYPCGGHKTVAITRDVVRMAY
ncbi:MAG: PDZ domain-containing protein [Myxococcales bacterium]|nr:PDZ domain-containing protein [Myxococcales bacterium]MCB9718518.1 PDZ domain-containing protein [Myxococcales bacterium]